MKLFFTDPLCMWSPLLRQEQLLSLAEVSSTPQDIFQTCDEGVAALAWERQRQHVTIEWLREAGNTSDADAGQAG